MYRYIYCADHHAMRDSDKYAALCSVISVVTPPTEPYRHQRMVDMIYPNTTIHYAVCNSSSKCDLVYSCKSAKYVVAHISVRFA